MRPGSPFIVPLIPHGRSLPLCSTPPTQVLEISPYTKHLTPAPLPLHRSGRHLGSISPTPSHCPLGAFSNPLLLLANCCSASCPSTPRDPVARATWPGCQNVMPPVLELALDAAVIFCRRVTISSIRAPIRVVLSSSHFLQQ